MTKFGMIGLGLSILGAACGLAATVVNSTGNDKANENARQIGIDNATAAGAAAGAAGFEAWKQSGFEMPKI